MGVVRCAAGAIALASCYSPAGEAPCTVACDFNGSRSCPGNLACEKDGVCRTPSGGCGDTYAAAVLADGPIAYWRLDDPPGSTTAHDTMGLADGRYMGNCTLGAAGAIAVDAAVQFNGMNCAVDIPGNAKLIFAGSSAYTIEAWAAADPSTHTYMHVFTHETRLTGPIDGYALLFQDPGNVFTERAVNGNNFSTAPLIVQPGDFHYLAATFDGNALAIHVDNSALTLLPAGTSANTIAVDELIGAATATSNFFEGTIDEVAIYDYALSPEQLGAHFAARD